MRGPLDAVRLRQLFDELSDDLRWTRTRVQIYVVGGAAMSLAFARDRTTLDVDARIVSGHQRMIEVVQKIARKHGLDDSWLNEQATTAIPRKPDATAQVLARHLLAMKLLPVVRHLDLGRPEEAVAIYEELFPDDDLKPAAAQLLTTAFEGDTAGGSPAPDSDRNRK